MPVTPLIDVKNIDFSYETHHVLEDVSFDVQEGDYLGIIGPNGSGKTTLLRLLLGLLKPQKGEITIFGQSPDQLSNRSVIGYVPQRIASADFSFPATVYEVVRSGRTAKTGLLSFFNQEDEKAVQHAMEITGVTKNKDRLVSKLSGGEKQRVFIARSLASEPKLLVLDEPTVGVDIASQETFYTLLCELNKTHKLTIILVSHDIDVVAQEVKNVLFLNRKVIAYGPAKEIMHEGALEKLYGSQVKFIQHKH